jgi:hypothetical protein
MITLIVYILNVNTFFMFDITLCPLLSVYNHRQVMIWTWDSVHLEVDSTRLLLNAKQLMAIPIDTVFNTSFRIRNEHLYSAITSFTQ